MNTRHAVVGTVIGEITLVAAGDAVTGVYFPRHWTNPPRETFGVRVEPAGDALLELAGSQLVEYLDGRRTTFDLPTAATGDPFQQRVWALLAQIPTGRTATYGDLAEQLGDRRLARSVGLVIVWSDRPDSSPATLEDSRASGFSSTWRPGSNPWSPAVRRCERTD